MSQQESKLTISPWRVTRILLLLTGGLTIAHVMGMLAKYGFGHNWVWGLVPAFDLSKEINIPTWYASSTLLLAAGLYSLIATKTIRTKGRYAGHWILMSLIFVFLSLDEYMSIHESWAEPIRNLLQTTGVLYFAWMLPYGLFVFVVGLLYWKFLLALPIKTRNLLLLAALLYLGGAVGVEMIEANYISYFSQFGFDNPMFAMMEMAGELLEMLGIVVLIHALLCHISLEGIIAQVTSDTE